MSISLHSKIKFRAQNVAEDGTTFHAESRHPPPGRADSGAVYLPREALRMSFDIVNKLIDRRRIISAIDSTTVLPAIARARRRR